VPGTDLAHIATPDIGVVMERNRAMAAQTANPKDSDRKAGPCIKSASLSKYISLPCSE
jgi:hypothetical protein